MLNPVQTQTLPQLRFPEPPYGTSARSNDSFTSTLQSAMDQVDELQASADQKVAALLHGESEDVHSAMIAVEHADLSFQLMMQVRNKVVNAYQEIARMQF